MSYRGSAYQFREGRGLVMKQRFPTPNALANSRAKLSIVYRSRSGPRLYEVSPAAAGAVVAGGALVAAIALSASLYVLSRDNLMRTVLNGQARMQYAYEDRIARLRSTSIAWRGGNSLTRIPSKHGSRRC